MNIEIIAIPPGEAPEHIRAQWLGICLPLLINKESVFQTVGVLSGPKTLFAALSFYFLGGVKAERGYAVSAKIAIDILEQSSPEAAQWWKHNTNMYTKKNAVFVFHSHVCLKKL